MSEMTLKSKTLGNLYFTFTNESNVPIPGKVDSSFMEFDVEKMMLKILLLGQTVNLMTGKHKIDVMLIDYQGASSIYTLNFDI